jgi:hypothetical protein
MAFGPKSGGGSSGSNNGNSGNPSAGGSTTGNGGGQLERILDSLGTSSSSSSGSNSSPSGNSSSRRDKKVTTPVLPWMLATSSRLDTRDLTHLASYRGLGAMLELGLTSMAGHLAVRGTDAALLTGEVRTYMNEACCPYRLHFRGR